MKQRWKQWVSMVLALGCCTTLAMAAESGSSNGELSLRLARQFFAHYGTGYGASALDLSTQYLAEIFGSVGGVLVSPSMSIFGTLMRYFNLGVLGFAGGVISVSTAMSVVNTSSSGRMLAGKAQMAPLAFRTFGAVSMLTPLTKLGGYSTIQAVVLWGVLQGVGVANGIWNHVVDQLSRTGGGLVITADMVANANQLKAPTFTGYSNQQMVGSAVTMEGGIDLALKIYQAQLCFYSNKQKLMNANGGTSNAQSNVITNMLGIDSAQFNNNLIEYDYPKEEVKLVGASNIEDCSPSISYSSNYTSILQNFRNQTITSLGDWWSSYDQSVAQSDGDRAALTAASFNLSRLNSAVALYNTMDALAQTTFRAAYADQGTIDYNGLTCMSDGLNGCAVANTIVSAATDYIAVQKNALLAYLTTMTSEATVSNFGTGGWLSVGYYYSQLAKQFFASTVDTSDLIKAVRSYTMPLNMGISTGPLKLDYTSWPLKQLTSLIGLDDMSTTFSGGSYSTIRQGAYTVASNIDYSLPATTTDDGALAQMVPENDWTAVKQGLMKATIFFSSPSSASGILKMGDWTNTATYNLVENGGSAEALASQTDTNLLPTPRDAVESNGWMEAWYKDGEAVVASVDDRMWDVVSAMGCSGAMNLGMFGYSQVMGVSLGTCDNVSGIIEGSPSSFLLVGQPGYFMTSAEDVINSGASDWVFQDVQIFLYQATKAWIQNMVGDICDSSGCSYSDVFGHITASPLDQLKGFGFDFTSAGITFLAKIMQDVFITNVTLMYHYIGIQIAMNFASAILSGIGSLLGGAGAWFENTIPFIGIILGIVMRVLYVIFAAVGSIIKAVSSAQVLGYYIVKAKMLMYVPIAVAAAIPVILMGMLAFSYAPMLPFIVFTFTAIGWFISVIEAVVGAPLIALGMTSPTGHDFLGRAEQSMMLFLSVIVRPALLLMGFLFAVLLVYIGVWMTSQIFVAVFVGMMSTPMMASLDYKAYYAAFVLIIFMFCYVIIGVIELAMSLIYRLPNFIMRWLGVPVREYGESNYLRALKNSYMTQIQGVSQGASNTYGISSKDTASSL